jgi:hypothetical protein
MRHFIITFIFFNLISFGFAGNDTELEPQMKSQVQQWVRSQPVEFLENKGQLTDMNHDPVPFVLFKTEAPGLDMYITEKGLTYVFVEVEEDEEEDRRDSRKQEGDHEKKLVKWARVDMELKGARIRKENINTEGISDWAKNYYFEHSPDGVRDVHSYKKITIRNIYPNIDWVLYNSGENGFKYDFIVHPGADPDQIRLLYHSQRKLSMDGKGNINIRTPYGDLVENAPACLYERTTAKIASNFVKTSTAKNETEIAFHLAEFDRSQTLIIDPQMVWMTRIAGNGLDSPKDISVDNSSVIAVTGYTTSTDFPVMSSFQGTLIGSTTAFVMKFGPGGNLIWSTYYGGNTEGHGVETDAAGNIIIAGIGSNVSLKNPGGGAYFQAAGGGDSFIAKFNSAGALVWATLYGGNGLDYIYDLCKDGADNIYITGYTGSNNFPVQNAAFPTYAGPANVYDAFVVKFNSSGQRVYATYIGGTGTENGLAMFADNSGNLYLTGQTTSTNFPTLNPGGGAYFSGTNNGGTGDAFITKLSPTGALVWSTYWGGSSQDKGMSLIGSNTGDWYFTGETSSANLATLNPGGGSYFQGTNAGGVDMYLCRFNSSDGLIWSTYFGTPGNNWFNQQYNFGNFLATDNCGNMYLIGEDDIGGLPVVNTCNSFTLNYAVSPSSQQSYIAEFNKKNAIVWGSYFYNASYCGAFTIKLDANNNIFTVGEHRMSNLPPYIAPAGAYLQNTSIGSDDGYLVKFIPTPNKYTQPQVNPAACSCNGSATINVTCGAAPYNYLWSNGSQTLATNSTSNTITNLCPGNYWVEITDDACGRDTVYYTLTTTGSFTLSSTQNNVSCNATCNGSATVTVGGGTPPYIYSWSSGQTTAGVTGLCAGSYSIVATDGGGCKSVQSINIIQTPVMVLGFSMQWSCASNNSSATVSVTNGSSAYTYSWSDGQTSQTAGGLTLASYTITVTDSKGCSVVQTVNIPQPTPLAVTPASVNTTCGNANGTATATPSNGTTPYTYSWSNGATTLTAINLAAGTYTVTVSDGNGCTKTAAFNIAASVGPIATFTISPACVGTAVNFTNTGTPPGSGITYNWLISPGNISGQTTDFSYTFLTTGSYSIQHTVYSGGCNPTVTTNFTVVNCTAGPAIIATSSTICSGSCAAVISTPTGGTNPYTYSWSTGETTQNINPCPPSSTTYTVKVTDAGGMTATATATVTVSPAISVTATPILNCAANSGNITASVTGGSSSFTYSWSNGVTAITSSPASQISNLGSNTYSVTVTDSKGCVANSSAIIDPPFAAQYIKGEAICTGCGCKEWIMVTPFNGRAPYTYIWPDGYDKRYMNKLCPGTYTINVTDKNGCTVNMLVNTP